MKSALILLMTGLSVSVAEGASFSDEHNTLSIKQTISFGYSGAITDTESQLQYLNARYYHPLLNRFISWDSFPLMNRYTYADGNPIMKTDPSGHTPFTDAVKALFGKENALSVEEVLDADKSFSSLWVSYPNKVTQYLAKCGVPQPTFEHVNQWLDIVQEALNERMIRAQQDVSAARLTDGKPAFLKIKQQPRDIQAWLDNVEKRRQEVQRLIEKRDALLLKQAQAAEKLQQKTDIEL